MYLFISRVEERSETARGIPKSRINNSHFRRGAYFRTNDSPRAVRMSTNITRHQETEREIYSREMVQLDPAR
jgi:hypothetical protein